jgi:hypothetical protein
MIDAPAQSAWYVFGVVDAAAAPPDGARLVEDGPLAAVVTEVSLEDFGEEVLTERLNDREWLEYHVRAHEELLVRAAEATTVVPFRFGAVYRELDDVAGMLRTRREELLAALERVRGRVELGVKAWADRARLEESLGEAPAAATAGRAYLERRRNEQERAQRASELLGEIARDAHTRLLEHAVEGVANRPQPRELTGREETMILNGAYLVADDGAALAEAVRALEQEHAGRGIAFELTGPWPPHNFVASPEDG